MTKSRHEQCPASIGTRDAIPRRMNPVLLAGLAAGASGGVLFEARRRRRIRRSVRPDLQEHERKVARIAHQLQYGVGKGPVSISKRAVSHEVPKPLDARHADTKIDARDLDAILMIDPERKTCTAESGVTFVDLVAATLEHGLVPEVVPELKTITLGGAVSGCSIESSSFRVGGFHDSCLAYEVVTGTGDVIECTPDNDNSLVFQMMHGSFGTLGVLTKLTFRLVEAKRYVHVVYDRFERLEDYLEALERHTSDQDIDFMDSILHQPDHLVLSLGRFVDTAPYTHGYDVGQPYYKTTLHRMEDYLATPDYFFRYDRGVTNVSVMGSSALLRLGQWLHPLLDGDRPDVTLDVFIPVDRVPEFLTWYNREIGFFPLWGVPYRAPRDYEWLAPGRLAHSKGKLFLDLAIYGMKQPPGRNVYRLIEEELLRIGGLKTLISHNYFSEAEFWSIWNKGTYDIAKRKVDPNNVFRDVYTKTCRTMRGLEHGA